jgi:hypothetical protein
MVEFVFLFLSFILVHNISIIQAHMGSDFYLFIQCNPRIASAARMGEQKYV